MHALVAYSGKMSDEESGPGEFTDANMNLGIGSREPSEAFKEDQYRVPLVANKYQTGFDHPVFL